MLTRILVPLDGSELAERIPPEILTLAGPRGAEIHGRSSPRRFMRGSVAETLVRHPPIPVLLVRGLAPVAPPADDSVFPLHHPTHPPDLRQTGGEGGAPH
jgi:hypothetical protein